MNKTGRKKFFAPDGTWCASIPEVRKFIAAVKDGTASKKRKRAKRKTNTNTPIVHTFEQENLKHLVGWKLRESNSRRSQYMTPFGDVCTNLNEVRKFIQKKTKTDSTSNP